RRDKGGYILVATPRLRQTAREDYLLHEGGRSDLQCRLLQRLNEATNSRSLWSQVRRRHHACRSMTERADRSLRADSAQPAWALCDPESLLAYDQGRRIL